MPPTPTITPTVTPTITPTITAAVIVYNRVALIARALDSILAQTTPVTEIVVVDDGSTDGTADLVAQRYGDRVRLIRQPNGGVSAARLRALTEARGEWLAFLDSDDEWTEGRNAAFLRAAQHVPPEVQWIFGDCAIMTDAGETGRLFRDKGFSVHSPHSPHGPHGPHGPQGPHTDPEVFQDPMATQFPYQFSIMPASLIRCAALRQVHAFTEGLRSSEDLLAGWKVAALFPGRPLAAIPHVVTRVYRDSSLLATSTDVTGKQSPDYYHARVIGFDLLARSNRPPTTAPGEPSWGRLHADAVRRWCIRLADSNTPTPRRHPFPLALAQFKHSLTPKAAAFLPFTLLGRPGVKLWKSMTERRDRRTAQRSKPVDPMAFSVKS